MSRNEGAGFAKSTSRILSRALLAVVLLTIGTAATESSALSTITKPPDLGPYWTPLSPNGGSYVYADSFVAPASGLVTDLGTWLTDEIRGFAGNGGTDLRLEVYGSVGGDPANGPDTANVLATTGSLSGLGIGPLSFYSAAPLSGGTPLVAGNTYWFGANVVGESAPPGGAFQVGGHTQNSVVVDNGTFWISNDPLGVDFTAQSLVPEMAFSVTVVPEPTTLALAGLGLAGLAVYGRRGRKRSPALETPFTR